MQTPEQSSSASQSRPFPTDILLLISGFIENPNPTFDFLKLTSANKHFRTLLEDQNLRSFIHQSFRTNGPRAFDRFPLLKDDHQRNLFRSALVDYALHRPSSTASDVDIDTERMALPSPRRRFIYQFLSEIADPELLAAIVTADADPAALAGAAKNTHTAKEHLSDLAQTLRSTLQAEDGEELSYALQGIRNLAQHRKEIESEELANFLQPLHTTLQRVSENSNIAENSNLLNPDLHHEIAESLAVIADIVDTSTTIARSPQLEAEHLSPLINTLRNAADLPLLTAALDITQRPEPNAQLLSNCKKVLVNCLEGFQTIAGRRETTANELTNFLPIVNSTLAKAPEDAGVLTAAARASAAIAAHPQLDAVHLPALTDTLREITSGFKVTISCVLPA